MDDYTEPWLKINETFNLLKSPAISVATIKPSALFDYISVLTIASSFYP